MVISSRVFAQTRAGFILNDSLKLSVRLNSSLVVQKGWENGKNGNEEEEIREGGKKKERIECDILMKKKE